MSIRILLVDDHGILRAGLRALLSPEPGFDVVGEVADGLEAVELAKRLNPDVILMDISMPGLGGLDATRQILSISPQMRVLLLTVHEDYSLVREAIKVGAAGYILKRALESELLDAIRAVSRGELYIHPAITRALLEESPVSPEKDPGGATLTQREYEVLRMIAHGYTNRQIAEQLSLSIRTVESHRSNLMNKLGLHSRVDLVRYATRHQLINADARGKKRQ
jgi:two-component system, NarL family, response regulator NreC